MRPSNTHRCLILESPDGSTGGASIQQNLQSLSLAPSGGLALLERLHPMRIAGPSTS